MGSEHFDEAKRRAWENRKFTKEDQKAIAKHYREEVKRIEGLRAKGEQGHIPLKNYD
jgi:hypothetical protein